MAKAPKYAVRESGDSVELIERPQGGLSLVMADGQRSGRSAKAISSIAVLDPVAEARRLGASAPEGAPKGTGPSSGSSTCTAQQLADRLLDCALGLDDGRPGDDVTVVVVQVLSDMMADGPEIRRMTVSFPVPPA